MGNKGSKGEGGEQQAQQHDQNQQQQLQHNDGKTTLKGPVHAEQSIQQSTTTTTANTGSSQQSSNNTNNNNTGSNQPGEQQTARHIEVGLAEFGTSDNISAQESYNHWETNAKKDSNGNDGAEMGGKVRNKELEKTMRNTMRNTMCNGDLRQLVKLPPNADANEWIALNTIHFYRTCSQIGETYRDLCTPQTCPLMSAGNVEYLWKDDTQQFSKPTRVPACMYMEYALRDAYATIDDPKIFPADDAQAFPRTFVPKVKEIFKRLFRQFAHLYYSHYDQVKQGGSSKHLNSTFKHFIYFVLEFNLIDQQTLSPLQKFIDHIIQQNPAGGSGGDKA